jgi:membrane associated rhomboid family serine protease
LPFEDRSKGLTVMRAFFTFLAAAVVVTLQAGAAQAYIGPGVASGALAAVVGVLGAIFLALFAVIYYPIKRLLKRRKAVSGDTGSDTAK